MGADGGYCYISEAGLKKLLSAEDIALFIKFTKHSLGRDTWKEDVDVRAYELEQEGEWLRYPSGTDVHISCPEWADDHYQSSPEEVWYFREYAQENANRYHWWWLDPSSWYVWETLISVPTPEELEALTRITILISSKCPIEYLETWT